MVGEWRAEARDWIPPRSRSEALDAGACIGVVAAGDVAKVLPRLVRCPDLVQRWVDEAQRMTCHLVGDRHDTGPKRRAGACAPDRQPVPMKVDTERRAGIGCRRDIGHATSV